MYKVCAWEHHSGMCAEINETTWLGQINGRACSGNVTVPTRQWKHYAWCIDASAGSISHYDDAQLQFAHSDAFVVHRSLQPWYASGCYTYKLSTMWIFPFTLVIVLRIFLFLISWCFIKQALNVLQEQPIAGRWPREYWARHEWSNVLHTNLRQAAEPGGSPTGDAIVRTRKGVWIHGQAHVH